jgi:ubiquinone/menaquinone biosynthesis C-methylase UbiE
MSQISETDKYSEVIKANIALHSKMSEYYNTCEPHFRPENIQKVEGKLLEAINATKAEKLLDLGCGTGFMINIAKKYVKEITGVDVTQAMLDKVDFSGNAKINLINHDTASVALEFGSYDVVTAYSFLHHLYDVQPTFKTSFNALKPGGKFYADLEPNYYFWEKIHQLDRNGKYDPIVKREIEMVTYKDEDIEKNFGVEKDIFNNAEFGKNIKGGFQEEDLREHLLNAGFTKVDFFYHWYIGQAALINDEHFSKEERFKYADVMDTVLQRLLPLSKDLVKYVGFIATK